MHYLLKGRQPIILALGRGLKEKLAPQFQKPFEDGRLLIVSPFEKGINRVTQQTATVRNKRKFTYEEIVASDKTSLDITWLKDKSLADLDNLPDPDVLAEEKAENLESALGSFQGVLRMLRK